MRYMTIEEVSIEGHKTNIVRDGKVESFIHRMTNNNIIYGSLEYEATTLLKDMDKTPLLQAFRLSN